MIFHDIAAELERIAATHPSRERPIPFGDALAKAAEIVRRMGESAKNEESAGANRTHG